MGAARRGLVVAAPAGVRNDLARIGRALPHDEGGEQVRDLGDAQRDERRAGRSPFFRGRCRARIAARKA